MVYNVAMIKIEILKNEENQRLDRFLRKYYRNAPLSYIYKLLRTGVRVNGKRVTQNTKLVFGDVITIDISEEEEKDYLARQRPGTAKRQFRIAYEDENILVAEKPFDLLTHGTAEEEKETLANQVIGYLMDSGSFEPDREKTFVPSPANRLDRNTTGLIIFGKNAAALRSVSQMLREGGCISKYYLTIVHGEIREAIELTGRIEKDRSINKVHIQNSDTGQGKLAKIRVRPLKTTKVYTLAEVELITGRTHQIRAQLADAGYPVAGDKKYGDREADRRIRRELPLEGQLLHGWRLVFKDCLPPLEYMSGKEVRCELPGNMKHIEEKLFT